MLEVHEDHRHEIYFASLKQYSMRIVARPMAKPPQGIQHL